MTIEQTILETSALNKMRWYGESDIVSYSHTIADGVLEEWNAHSDYLKMKKTGNHQFELQFTIPQLDDDNRLYIRATMVSTIFLVSLNVGAFGHFWYPSPAWPFRYKLLYDLKNKRRVSINVRLEADRQWGNKPLSVEDMRRTTTVFPIIHKLNEAYFELYSIGTTLLGAGNLEHQFYTEVFSAFYRLIERFIKVEVLREPTGNSVDVNRIKKALNALGLTQSLLDEFHNLYVVRGRDAMHALGKEQDVTFEEAGKCKVICDVMLFKYCQQQWLKANAEREPQGRP